MPQAPAFGDSKLILSAAKVSTARTAARAGVGPAAGKRQIRGLKSSLIPVLLLVGTGGLALLLWHDQLTSLANRLAERATSPAARPAPIVFQSPHTIPQNVSWTLNVTNAPIPNAQAAGSVHGNGFLCERATLKGDRLSLRQGPAGPPELGITVTVANRRPEELAGKVIVVSPVTPVPAPRVILRWKDDQQEPVTQHIHAGYAMKLLFGPIVDNRLHGRIYIALPDEHKSFAAGNFEAEIGRPSQPLAGK